ncbi:MAG: PaaI family thioesterase [Hyphomicrobiales bacterium]
MMTLTEMRAFLDREFPQLQAEGRYIVEELRPRGARLRAAYHESQIRPGGTLSGPTMMTLADVSLYVAVLAAIGPVALAVTTNLNINFLRKPAPRDLVSESRLMKLGRRLAVGEVTIFSDGEDEPVAHVTGTYSIPPR